MGCGLHEATILAFMNPTRSFWIMVAMAITISSLGCTPPRPARINHIVFFKLQNPDDRAELIADCDRDLATIPGVKSYFCGVHGDYGRDLVDSSYDVGFYVGFETDEAYENYLSDPRHVAVVQKWKPRWEWIRIADVVDDSP